MGVSEVLLCPYRCLEYKMERYDTIEEINVDSKAEYTVFRVFPFYILNNDMGTEALRLRP